MSDCFQIQVIQLAHEDQRRAFGRPYEEHPIDTAPLFWALKTNLEICSQGRWVFMNTNQGGNR